MQDLDDGVRLGRGRLSAASGEPPGKVSPFLADSSVVPARRLLDVASALSDGASQMHARLRHLDPVDREAVLDLMAGQLSSIVNLWTDLVRGVVSGPSESGPSESGASESGAWESGASESGTTESGVSKSGPTGMGRLLQSGVSSGASTGASTGEPQRRVEGPGSTGEAWSQPTMERRSEPAGPDPDPGPGVRLLRRRPTTAATSASASQPWTTPLRTVTIDEPEPDYEGDRLTRDELTGVLNRQAGFAALGRELDRCRRAGERFVLGYLDVDGLKTVNSVDGPRAGDELLRKVTAALRATLRSYDVIMRLGGDEFLFSLPGADMATAELRANEFGIILNEEAPGASASVGYSELRGNDTLDEIISRAEIELVKNRRSRVRMR